MLFRSDDPSLPMLVQRINLVVLVKMHLSARAHLGLVRSQPKPYSSTRLTSSINSKVSDIGSKSVFALEQFHKFISS